MTCEHCDQTTPASTTEVPTSPGFDDIPCPPVRSGPPPAARLRYPLLVRRRICEALTGVIVLTLLGTVIAAAAGAAAAVGVLFTVCVCCACTGAPLGLRPVRRSLRALDHPPIRARLVTTEWGRPQLFFPVGTSGPLCIRLGKAGAPGPKPQDVLVYAERLSPGARAILVRTDTGDSRTGTLRAFDEAVPGPRWLSRLLGS